MTTETLDAPTIDAIRSAIAAASAGRVADALAIGEQALRDGGETVALNAMLGTIKARDGQFDAAVDHLRLAHESRKSDLVILSNLVGALVSAGREDDALDVLSEEAAALDPSLGLLKTRGFLAQSTDRFDVAIDSYRKVIDRYPDDWESLNNLGNAYRGNGDLESAVDVLRRAVELAPDSPPIRFNLATALDFSGRVEEAEAAYRQLADDLPDDPRPLRELYAMMRVQMREEAASEVIAEASRRAPQDLELLLALASQHLTMRHHDQAEAAYRRALQIDASNTLAFLGIATVLDQVNRVEELAGLVTEAKEAGVAAEGLSFVKAFDHRRAKRFEEGLEALAQVPDHLETARRQLLLGQLLEGAGRYDEAFAAFERMNAITRDDPSQPMLRGEAYRDLYRRQLAMLTTDWRDDWVDVPAGDRPSPVFLVGFPRSGTTLLDTILMSHPDTEVMEEEPTLNHAMEVFGTPDTIAPADQETVERAREAYFAKAATIVPLANGKLLVDKNPLAMNQVPLIRKLFPDARIILALRHPCDVVLSCFVTNFKLNNGMVSFLTLDGAADLYDLSFSNFEASVERFDPPVHRVSYENIVEDRDAELRPLFDFLGLEWDDRVLDHQTTAKSRGHIKTASYAQVIEPIYKRSAGRWHHYREQLEPIIPVLKPWIDKFGYKA